MTEKELVVQVHSQPLEAFRLIYQRYWARLFNIALKRLQDAVEASDIHNFCPACRKYFCSKGKNNYHGPQ